MQKDEPYVGFQGVDFGAKSDISGGGVRLILVYRQLTDLQVDVNTLCLLVSFKH